MISSDFQILQHPLTPVPLALCHLDGTIVKTTKSSLVKLLEREVESHEGPESIDVLLIDGFSLLYRLKQLPRTFGDMAMEILRMITTDNKGKPNSAKQIYLLFDIYKSPSIKDHEHLLRKNFQNEFCITGENYYYYFLYNVRAASVLKNILLSFSSATDAAPFAFSP